jgi:hypothetical protein
MKTVGEIDAVGRIVRVFHRTDTASWSHPPGVRYTYRGGRHGKGQVTMECQCRVSSAPVMGPTESDADGAGRGPGATQPGSARPQRAGRG